MISVDGVRVDTPYKGLYGRVSYLLHNLESAAATVLEDDVGGIPGTTRHIHRPREASIAAIAKASASHQADIAFRTRTKPTAGCNP